VDRVGHLCNHRFQGFDIEIPTVKLEVALDLEVDDWTSRIAVFCGEFVTAAPGFDVSTLAIDRFAELVDEIAPSLVSVDIPVEGVEGSTFARLVFCIEAFCT
jgi:hypothetical protein